MRSIDDSPGLVPLGEVRRELSGVEQRIRSHGCVVALNGSRSDAGLADGIA